MLTEYSVADYENNRAIEEQCVWRLCDNIAADGDEFARHIFFHAFHTKIKADGLALQQENSLQVCNVFWAI